MTEPGNDPCSFCHFFPGVLQVKLNTFVDNSEGPVFFEEHKLPRASHIYATGGAMYSIVGNSFVNAGAIFDVKAKEKLPTYVSQLPDGYFSHLQSPMFRIEIPSGVDDFYDALVGTDDVNLRAVYQNSTSFAVSNVTFTGNVFVSVTTVEPFVKAQTFKASVL